MITNKKNWSDKSHWLPCLNSRNNYILLWCRFGCHNKIIIFFCGVVLDVIIKDQFYDVIRSLSTINMETESESNLIGSLQEKKKGFRADIRVVQMQILKLT